MPNSYDKGFDFMDFLKKEYISTIVNNIFTNKTSTTTPKIYTEIQNIINNKNKYLNEIVETEVILIIIKIIDKMIISIIKNNIYIGCVNKLKNKIINSVHSITSYNKIFDKIITQKNVTLKLDKMISDMINIENSSLSSSFDPKKLNEIVDNKIVSKIISNQLSSSSKPVNEPNEIHKKDNNQYLVFYNTDYNSIVPISIRQCMFNSIQIIKNLFSTKNKPDIFKLDSNGFTPIYYGIKNKNYLLIRELVNSTDNFYIQYQLNKYTASPIKYAFEEFLKYSETPKWVNINDTFINNLLLSAQINQNIPTKYNKIYFDLIKFLNKDVIETHFKTIEIDISNESVVKKWLFTNNTDSINRFDDFKIIINTINSLIIGKKSISSEFEKLINLKKQLNFDGKINEIKKLIIMFEKRYGKKELKYTAIVPLSTSTTPTPTTELKNDNYFNIVVNMGIVAIRKIFNYYNFILQKLILTSNAYNNSIIDKKKIIDNLMKNMDKVIKLFFTNNGENLVRTFYFIKKDKFDRLDNTISVIDNYMTILLENLNQNGIVIPDSDIEKNIKQYINPHVGELLSKTLLYNQLLIDISHKYIINIYHSIKTLDELTKKK